MSVSQLLHASISLGALRAVVLLLVFLDRVCAHAYDARRTLLATLFFILRSRSNFPAFFFTIFPRFRSLHS